MKSRPKKLFRGIRKVRIVTINRRRDVGRAADLVDVRVNCEQNSLLYRVRPRKQGACHTRDAEGRTRETCYYRRLEDAEKLTFV